MWAAFFLTADTNHAASYAWLDGHTAAGGLVISPSILLTEVAAAISRRLGPPAGAQAALRAAAAIGRLPQARIVPMDAALMSEATKVAANLGYAWRRLDLRRHGPSAWDPASYLG